MLSFTDSFTLSYYRDKMKTDELVFFASTYNNLYESFQRTPDNFIMWKFVLPTIKPLSMSYAYVGPFNVFMVVVASTTSVRCEYGSY